MRSTVRFQLSLMMLLEYFIWGAWFVAMGIYLPAVLQADGIQVGLAYGNAWFGALVSPFFIGMIADRYFSAQKVLGVLHLIGAVLLYWLAQIRDIAVFPWILLLYSCVYMPTVALTNAVAMGQSSVAVSSQARIDVTLQLMEQTCSTSHLQLACSGGRCDGLCASGYTDCDGNKQTNGCETLGACTSPDMGTSVCTFDNTSSGFDDCLFSP